MVWSLLKELSGDIKMPNNNLSFVSKFVTDCNQKAVLKGDTIEVISYVGRRKVFSYKLPLSEWTVAENAFGNHNYYKRELINKYTDNPRFEVDDLSDVS